MILVGQMKIHIMEMSKQKEQFQLFFVIDLN